MENRVKKFKQFLIEYWHWEAFFCGIFLALFFLTFQGGIWTYIDLGHEIASFWNKASFFENLSHALSNVTYFGYNNVQLISTRLINISAEIFLKNIFSQNIAQIAYFFVYFLVSFISFQRCLSLVFDKKSSYFGALLFAFNPLSLYLLDQAGFFFIYFSLPIVIYSFVKYFQEKRIGFAYLLLFSLGISLLTSYARISFIYGIILLALAITHHEEIINIIKFQKKKLVLLFFVTFLVATPISFSFIHPYLSGGNEYFSGISNYASAFEDSGSGVYGRLQNFSFSKGFILSEVTSNFAGNFQSTPIFTIFSLVYFSGIFIYALFMLKRSSVSIKYRKLFFSFVFLFIGGIFLRMLAQFVSEDSFIKLAYGYLPFLANTTNWVMFLCLISFIGILTFAYAFSERRVRIALGGVTVVYIFLSMMPFVLYQDNEKLSTIKEDNFPVEYQNIFAKNNEPQASLFFPAASLYFSWSPYPIAISRVGMFQALLTDNVRLTNRRQGDLRKSIYSLSGVENLQNLSVLNLKNIFVFKDIRNAESGQFDFFSNKDYVAESKKGYELMKNNSDFMVVNDNSHFAQFQPKNVIDFEYSIYSPKDIIKSEVETILTQNNIDPEERPVLVDKESFHKPDFINSFRVLAENQNIHVDIKASPENKTKFYLKLSNLDATKPFLLQLNQTFGVDWKLHWVDQSMFEEKRCVNEVANYSITNNSVCYYESALFELGDAKFISASRVSDKNHFEGNLVGNTWIVQPEDIPAEMREQKELYAVLVYEKQTYYSYALLISITTFLILLVLSCYQGLKSFRQKYSIKFDV